MALFAIEVGVLVVMCVVVVALASLVAQGTAAILDGVHEMVVEEKRERAEYGAAFGSGHAVLQFTERKRSIGLHELAHDQQAHGGGPHTMVLKMFFDECFVLHLSVLERRTARELAQQ